MAEPTAAPEASEYKLPPPGAYPSPPIADYPRLAVEEPVTEPPLGLPERLVAHILAWRTVAALALIAIFILAATAGGFEITHIAIAAGCFALALTSGAAGVLLGWENERLSERVKLLEEVSAHLLERGNRRAR